MTRSDTLTERVHRITIGDGRSTEALVEAGHYGYAHSAVVFLHEPWVGYFGRRDVLLLWTTPAGASSVWKASTIH